MRIKITFESGKIIFAKLNQDSKTAHEVYKVLPFYSKAVHSRWSGKEINFQIPTSQELLKENQTIYVSLGEICYWSNWKRGEKEEQINVLAIYYGAEMTRSQAGPEPVNVIGQVESSDIEALKELGESIWLKGIQTICMERA